MVSINNLGDTLSVRLTRGENFSNVATGETLTPPIDNASYFRILSNHVCEIYVSFAFSSAVLNSDGQLSETRTVIVGLEDVWYRCSNKVIFRPTVFLVNPSTSDAQFDSIDLIFQFVNKLPDDYIFSN